VLVPEGRTPRWAYDGGKIEARKAAMRKISNLTRSYLSELGFHKKSRCHKGPNICFVTLEGKKTVGMARGDYIALLSRP
jgi:hypothetical protein